MALAVLGHAPAVWAHARMVRAVPENKAQLARSPEQVDLWFNELLDESFNTVEVYPSNQVDVQPRADLVAGPAQLDAKDRTHITVRLQPLPPGEYVVEWRVLSRDGHSAPGRLRFRVTGGK